MHGSGHAHATAASPMGQPLLRREDPRLLRGRGQYVSDLRLPGMLAVALLRSPHAHARLVSLDLTAARALPGVTAVLGWADVKDAVKPFPAFDTRPRAWLDAVQPTIVDIPYTALVADVARYVGEPVAVVVAANRYLAEDARELIEAEWEPLPAVTDPEMAVAPGSPLVHPDLPGNVMIRYCVTKGDPTAALAAAPHRLRDRFYHHRYVASPLEGRGVVAAAEARTGQLDVWSSTQSVFLLRRILCLLLGLPEQSVRAAALDMGGGFGVKCSIYPEEVLCAHLTLRLGRPVQWVEDRNEHLTAANHARDQIHHVDVGFDGAGRLLALKTDFLLDNGAYNPWGATDAYNGAAHIQGPYRVPHLEVQGRCVATNKSPSSAYRGAGRPEVVFTMERVLDRIAAHLDLDPVEVRRRNMIHASELPYPTGVMYRDGKASVYDSGDYPAALEAALKAVDFATFRRRQAAARARGEYIGLGIGYYVEGTGVGPHEGATLRIDGDGRLVVHTGAVPHGQGHETALAQLTAAFWQLPVDQVQVRAGDTALIEFGVGTYASRTAVVVGNAIWHASQELQAKCRDLSAGLLECSPGDVELARGRFGVRGYPTRSLGLADLARAARPGWDHGRPPGMAPGLSHTYYYEPPTVTWAYAAHVAVVQVDPETAKVQVLNYAVAHDCGVVINPLIVDGQVAGGVAQGIGGALMEEMVYTDEGQLATATLMDYLLITAADLPHLELIHLEVPSPANPLGMKGLGEGGAIAPPAAVVGAVEDALRPLGVRLHRTPASPKWVAAALAAAR